MERENEILIKKRREDYLIFHLNESIDRKFREFNQYQLKPYVEGGAPVFLKPVHLDNNILRDEYQRAQYQQEMRIRQEMEGEDDDSHK